MCYMKGLPGLARTNATNLFPWVCRTLTGLCMPWTHDTNGNSAKTCIPYICPHMQPLIGAFRYSQDDSALTGETCRISWYPPCGMSPLNGSTSGTMQLPAITLAASIRDISVNLQVCETLFEKRESISAARFCAIHRCGGRPLWNLAGANKHLYLVPHHAHHLPNLLHCAKELSDVL